MGEYGLKIKNYQAGILYQYNSGARCRLDSTDAMLTNSLFLDFLLENGLNVWHDNATRDIICIDFNYGSNSYEKEMKELKKRMTNKLKECDEKDKEDIEQFYQRLMDDATEHKDFFIKKSFQDIRKEYYLNGVTIKYPVYKKDGTIKDYEAICYKMLYRTPGKAKKGSCMFINAELYDKAHDFLYMGIELPYENSPIVEMGAYSSLITSSIVGRVEIDPKNILILKDVDSFFETNVVSVETNENKECFARTIDGYKLKNTLFDGQALIDSSIFPEWGDGFILLRHHLCKMAAFCSNIQLFFKEYFGDDYSTAVVTDMWGNKHFAKDIQLITTDNAMKWLKFDISYEYWCSKVNENGNLFGIVKTAHRSKLGDMQRMSYQMVNALNIDTMDSITNISRNYVESMKQDETVFLDYLRKNINFSNDYEVLIALCEQNMEFTRSEYYRDRKRKIIEGYVSKLRIGKVIQNADNLVIVGSPYAMLLYSVGDDPEKDPTFAHEDGTIQCYTGRFKAGDYLAEFRSPFNSRNNMGYLHNVDHEYFHKYFNFGKQIIAVNMINTDFQDRNNGSDMDSDTIYTTNYCDIVSHAKYCYDNYPTIVNNIPKEKNSYSCTLENYAIIDNNLAAAQRAIGESSNAAQLALSYSYNFQDQKYQDYVCILSVVAQCAIDNAKRKFDIDLTKEIDRIKKDMDIQVNRYPKFWLNIKKDFKKSKVNPDLVCPMNYLSEMRLNRYRSTTSTLPMSNFFQKYDLEESRRRSIKVEEIICKYASSLYDIQSSIEDKESYILMENDFEQMINDIRGVYISKSYVGLMSWLIDRTFLITDAQKKQQKNTTSNTIKNRALLLQTLYHINPKALLMCFNKH